MLWACVRLPRLALDAVLRTRTDPARPLVLVEGPAQLRRLHSVNNAAAAAGLTPGMRLATAHALLPEVATIDHDPRADARTHALLAAWAYGYSSMVGTGWGDAVLLEVEASFHLFGPWARLESRLRDDLRALGFAHTIALAPTPRAAYAFAALRDGLAITDPRMLGDALARMPVRRAGLPGDAGARLHHMGMRTLDDVRGLPRAGLLRRFGKALVEHLECMRGEADDPVQCYAPPDRFDARIELECEVESSLALLFTLRRLVGDLAAYLACRDGGVQRFVLGLQHEAGQTDVPVGLLAAERDGALLFELARNRLEQASLPHPVVGLRLVAEQLPPFVPAVRDLFDTRPAQAMPWTQLRERLRARLGDDAVHRVAATADPRPERAWQCVVDDGDAPCAASAPLRPARPTWLLSRPMPLQAPPVRVLSGPERLESGWWDDGDLRRDYYIVETACGRHAWAYASVGERDGWMVQGWFG